MTLLTAIRTHLEPELVTRQLAYLRSLCPDQRFIVCHGGRRADFERLDEPEALFIEDPSLRGPLYRQSLNETLRLLYSARVRDDPAVELVYLIEYDHLILQAGFADSLRQAAEQAGAGLLAKAAGRRNDTNWMHYLRVRGDRPLQQFITSISCREDPEARWGCLGSGLLFRRQALAAFCAVPQPPPYYFEMFLPTTVYHLGFEVADFDALGPLCSAVRWQPDYEPAELLRLRRAGAVFAHPFKRVSELSPTAATDGAGENVSVAARSG